MFLKWADSVELRAFADRHEPARPGEPVEVYDFEPVRRALLISERLQNAELALVPGPSEWQVWSFDHASLSAFVSFADYLILDAIRSGGPTRAVGLLADWGDARALDAAFAMLVEPAVAESERTDAARALAALGAPRAIDPLLGGQPRLVSVRLDRCGPEGNPPS